EHRLVGPGARGARVDRHVRALRDPAVGGHPAGRHCPRPRRRRDGRALERVRAARPRWPAGAVRDLPDRPAVPL
ncbi:MAG: hypothetical protein AVDCRST_MAG48-445, partial [uncultured Friedmanniella sp.]